MSQMSQVSCLYKTWAFQSQLLLLFCFWQAKHMVAHFLNNPTPIMHDNLNLFRTNPLVAVIQHYNSCLLHALHDKTEKVIIVKTIFFISYTLSSRHHSNRLWENNTNESLNKVHVCCKRTRLKYGGNTNNVIAIILKTMMEKKETLRDRQVIIPDNNFLNIFFMSLATMSQV